MEQPPADPVSQEAARLADGGRLLAALDLLRAADPLHRGRPAWFAHRTLELGLLRIVGRTDDALRLGEEALALAEALGGGVLARALVDLAAAQPRTAVVRFEQLIERAVTASRLAADPEPEFLARVQAARMAVSCDDPVRAAACLRLAEALVPDAAARFHYCHALGRLRGLAGEVGEALAWFERSVVAAGTSCYSRAIAISAVGQCRAEVGPIGRAVVELEEAARLLRAADLDVPLLSDLYVVLGNCLSLADRTDEARAVYREALDRYTRARSPGVAHAIFHLGRLDLLAGDDEAAAEAARSIARTPGFPLLAAMLAIGTAAGARQAERFDDAMRELELDARPPLAGRLVVALMDLAAARAEGHAARPWLERSCRARRYGLAAARSSGLPAELAREERHLRRLASRGARPRLGPYHLQRRLDAGGFGEVWEAEDAAGGAVAVKVIRSRPDGVASLERELRAVASLDHPHVVRLLHHGVVDAAAAILDDRLTVGTPWIAMPLARGGTVQHRVGEARWPEIRSALLALLDALAHAHARGLVHLDVKPANLLLAPELRLADFGLAAATGTAAATSGTPHFMAPELYRNALREVGPWTDLYAVGCVASALVTGGPPFGGTTVDEVRRGHLQERPVLDPIVPVPRGLVGWILRLLAKDPADRFRCASDAARGLVALGPADGEVAGSAPVQPSELPTMVLPPMEDLPPVTVDDVGSCPIPEPVVPLRWERSEPAREAADPTGAGLGLFSVRATPFVGRSRQRALLWALLREAHARREVRLAAIETEAPGLGATALSAWVGERALEVGAASVVVAEGAPGEPPGTLFGRMLRRRLRLDGLDPGARGEHLGATLRAEGIGDLRAAVEAALEAPDGPELARVLCGLARTRPLVLRIERPEADPAVPALLEALEALPAAILVVVAGPSPAGVPVLLGPLPDDDVRQLAQRLLPLAPGLAERVVERAGGRPAFPIQLLTHLVSRQRLAFERSGWTLRDLEESLPDTLEALWRQRVEIAMGSLSREARSLLRAAAERSAVARDDGSDLFAEAKDRLLGARLAVGHAVGFAFADEEVRRRVASA